MDIPYLDLQRQNGALLEGFIKDLKSSVEGSDYILGDAVEKFESDFSEYLGSKHVVGVANGTDALELAVRALGLGQHDEVIVPANSFIASALGVTRAGAKPVFCDTDENFHIDLESARRMVSTRTKAIIVVSLYGQLPNMNKIAKFASESNLHVIEDFAQAQGATFEGKSAGTFGVIGCTSFYPGKNLGALGDGGAITTQSDEIYSRLLALRNYGSPKKYHHPIVGFNSRLDAIQAKFLSRKLTKLDKWNQERNHIADIYTTGLSGIDELKLPAVLLGSFHVWHIYAIRTPKRDELQKFLHDRGIASLIHYPVPINMQGAYMGAESDPEMALAINQSSELLSLPLFPGMTDGEASNVVEVVREFFAV